MFKIEVRLWGWSTTILLTLCIRDTKQKRSPLCLWGHTALHEISSPDVPIIADCGRCWACCPLVRVQIVTSVDEFPGTRRSSWWILRLSSRRLRKIKPLPRSSSVSRTAGRGIPWLLCVQDTHFQRPSGIGSYCILYKSYPPPLCTASCPLMRSNSCARSLLNEVRRNHEGTDII
jgi:hypothetical protein